MDSLDQFFTNPSVAQACFHYFLRPHLEGGEFFVEPSTGVGAFYQYLPADRRMGFEIDPELAKRTGSTAVDFLSVKEIAGEAPLVVVGNPPFGLRGTKALAFINHSIRLGAEYVAFILPPNFNSDGKGAPGKRVVGAGPIACYNLPADSFHNREGKGVKVKCVFQIWKRGEQGMTASLFPAKGIRVFSVSAGGTPASTRNLSKIGECDFYLPSTCYRGMKAYKSFEEMPYQRGYGIVVDDKSLVDKAFGHDWKGSAFTSTNGAINLRKSIIEGVLSGFASPKAQQSQTLPLIE